jgi:hypothetical protein
VRDDERSAESAARSPELQALLRDLDELRLSLATDLTLAAAAVEAGSPELASAVIGSDRAELEAFAQRALRHLEQAERAAAVVPRARRRALLAAVTPLLATAAAVLGVLAGVVPTGGPQPATDGGTAMASYQEVTRLTRDGAEAAQVARAAARLHEELAAIVAAASADPAAAQEALALLEAEARVLDGSVDRDKLSGVIAEARQLVARLRAALPVDVPVRTPRVPSPTAAPNDIVVPVEVRSAPALPAPPPPRPEPSPSSSPSPSAEPSPSPSQSGGADGSHDGSVVPAAVMPAD